MPDGSPPIDPSRAGPEEFASTQWSLVVRARDPDADDARAALTALCERYWYPLYAFIRRKVKSAQKAEDLTQGFFAYLLAKNALDGVDRSKGKFRSFLLTCCDHYLTNQWEHDQALKCGGGHAVLSLDFHQADDRYNRTPPDTLTPERLFDRRWALLLLEHTFTLLERECRDRGKANLYSLLHPVLISKSDALSYGQIAQALDMTQDAVKKAAERLRRRYGELLREQIAATVESPEQVEDEIRALFVALAS